MHFLRTLWESWGQQQPRGLRWREHPSALPPGWAIIVGLDDDHLHGHGRPEQVDHLLMGQSGHSHFADLYKAAPLAKASFPGEAKRFHISHNAFKVHVEAKLAQPVPPQGHFHGLAASGHYLRGQEAVRSARSGLCVHCSPCSPPLQPSKWQDENTFQPRVQMTQRKWQRHNTFILQRQMHSWHSVLLFLRSHWPRPCKLKTGSDSSHLPSYVKWFGSS